MVFWFRLSVLLGLGSTLAIAAYSWPSWLSGNKTPSKTDPSQVQETLPSLPLEKSHQASLTQALTKLQDFCLPPQTATTDQPSAESVPPAPPTLNPACPNWEALDLTPKATPEPVASAQRFQFMNWVSPPKPEPEPSVSPEPEKALPLSFPQVHRQARLAKVPIFMYHDILPRKEVFFDVTPAELEAHFQQLQKLGATPISPDWLLAHLRTGVPLPKNPVLLSFDDGYGGHYDHVYPLLKKYGYPAVFSIYVKKMDGKTARSSLTWEQLQELAKNPLITIASHSVNHPRDLRELSDDQLFQEVIDSKRILEQRLGIPITYFTYPEGKLDARVKQWAIAAGYQMAFAMDDNDEKFAGESADLFTIGRFGQSRLTEISPQAWGGYPVPVATNVFNFSSPIEKRNYTVNGIRIILISGGRPQSIHADSRYQVPDILKNTEAIAAVDGGFFSLKYLNSNTMIGPVMSAGGEFIPGYSGEIPKLNNRPLALMTANSVHFVPFNYAIHNTLSGVQQAIPNGTEITDAFVGAAWLVRDNQAQPPKSFGDLFDFDAARHRAFWGINQAGQPVIGVTKDPVGSVGLGRILYQLGFRDAIMLDSGASTSLAFQGESLVGYTPRPVPHVVALFPPVTTPK